ncbi:COMM domain-containing protein 2 [Culex quinquefasciatus]|uniref:COMM domain-containing protein 2 n=1 Tax=Culex quinquefasciatus TaxID=7176 RepID=B0XKE0_CULQU|nr:COMM domain-containing protein 2 [Culex quinquefasciatus]|eukprot:XP_001870112.1 COMM domain-containing protein 2 [Culex quinquefasciatus]
MAHLMKQEQDKHLKFVLNQPEEENLETTFDTVKSCVEALVCLLIDCTKLHITEEDFRSLGTLNFSPEQIAILWQFVSSKRALVESVLKQSADNELHFRDLEWRLEAKVASRALHRQATPVIAMKLHLDSEVVNEHKEKLDQESTVAAGETRKEVLLQTDPTSLVHLIQVLEQALIDSKTHRAGLMFGIRPAFCAIVTNAVIRRC